MYRDSSDPVIKIDYSKVSVKPLITQSPFSCLGHVIVITGIPYGSPKGWFNLRFTEGATKKQAFHVSVRFEPHFQVIRNSMDENCV